MTTTRRFVAAGAAGMLLLLAVAPSAWAAGPTMELTSPKPLVKQGDLTGLVSVEKPDTQTLSEMTFNLEPQSGPLASNDPCFVDLPEDEKFRQYEPGITEDPFGFDVSFPCNGTYKLSAFVKFVTQGVDGGLTGLANQPGEGNPDQVFSVAIPPVQVQGLKADYDAGSRIARLEWTKNPEPDVVGYFIERSVLDSTAGYMRIGGPQPKTETNFEDPDVDQEYLYRVVAVRRGPAPGQTIVGPPSLRRSAGPESTTPTNAPPPPTNNGGGGARSGNSSGGAAASGNAAQAPSRTRTTTDNGFEQSLPFDPSRTTTIPPTPEVPEDAAVLAEFDDEPTDQEEQRATLVPVAGGLALLVGASHMFLLSRRAGEDDIPIVARPGGYR